jgi:glutamyl-tRNA reductase
MLNQMMHEPIQRVKEMAPGRHGDEALEYFTKLFALEEANAGPSESKGDKQPSEPKEERLPLQHGSLSLA